MVTEHLGVQSAPMTIQIAPPAPGCFTTNFTGSGQAAALSLDGSINGQSHPASRGGYVSLYLTGAGQTLPPGKTGSLAGSTPEYLTQSISARVGGAPALGTLPGAAPTPVIRVAQGNLPLPDNTPAST